ncbi:serine/arginine-rich splicing factor 7-like isoform X1 [Diachasmimorpha longicaudata]|uniref:serine/arginine-rich splicing factor 7-like isoform X1 n=1 Tax=Diachasmimorpha longicaudata TaxID=58733 RepID=UPI0030B8FC21
MSTMSRYPSDCKIYVGDLGSSATKQDLEDAFSYYGPLRNVWVARNPPGFAFVEFEDARDADDAVRGLDGRTICGRRARVEHSNGKRLRDRGGGSRRGGAGGRPFHPEDRCYECGERGHYARDCPRHRGGRKRRSHSRSRSRSRSNKRSRSSSRSRSRSRSANDRRGRSRSKGRSDSKDRSPRRTRSRSASRSRSRKSINGDRNGGS